MSSRQQTDEIDAFIRSLREKALEKHRRSSGAPTGRQEAEWRLVDQHRRLAAREELQTSASRVRRNAPPHKTSIGPSLAIIEQLSSDPEADEVCVVEVAPPAEGTDQPEFETQPVAPEHPSFESVASPELPLELTLVDFDQPAADGPVNDPDDSEPDPAASSAIRDVSGEEVADRPAIWGFSPLPLKMAHVARWQTDLDPATPGPTFSDLPSLDDDPGSEGLATGQPNSIDLPKFTTLSAYDEACGDETIESMMEVPAPKMKVTLTRASKRSRWPFGKQKAA